MMIAHRSPSPIHWADVSVIDARAPRFNQAVVAIGTSVAVAFGAWPILGVLGLQLAVSVVFGRRWCLPCVAYFRLVQPRFGEGPKEDARAPRFANAIGAVFLLSATLAYALGFAVVGVVLAVLVAALASLAVVTGFCVGCEMYRVFARLRGVRGRSIDRIDLEQLGATGEGSVVVQFTHPLCSDCQALDQRLAREGRPVVTIDVSKRGDLAKKYGVALVPLAFEVRGDGTVTARLH